MIAGGLGLEKDAVLCEPIAHLMYSRAQGFWGVRILLNLLASEAADS